MSEMSLKDFMNLQKQDRNEIMEISVKEWKGLGQDIIEAKRDRRRKNWKWKRQRDFRSRESYEYYVLNKLRQKRQKHAIEWFKRICMKKGPMWFGRGYKKLVLVERTNWFYGQLEIWAETKESKFVKLKL